jgi:phosphate transport system substrate-binding protein
MRRSLCSWGLFGLFFANLASAAGQPGLDLPPYQPSPGLYGRLVSTGSDTLAPAMRLWLRKSLHLQPNVRISMRVGGSSLAPPALTNGKAQIGLMSRPMKPKEVEAFQQAHGYPPTAIQVAIDALTIYVNRKNPLQILTVKQLDAIFSDERRCGYPQAINSWGDLGLPSLWADKAITTVGRTPASGTYGFFRKKALCGGQYKISMEGRHGNTTVIQTIVSNDLAIGYAGIKFQQMHRVKAVLLAKDEAGQPISATAENALNGSYPLVRPLYIYIDKKPGRPAAPLVGEFIRMVLSDVGQKLVKKSGYIPLPADLARHELAKLK